jgi:Tol biopolymer transport system component
MKMYLISTIVLCCTACSLQKGESQIFLKPNTPTFTNEITEQSTAINSPSPIQSTKTITEILNLQSTPEMQKVRGCNPKHVTDKVAPYGLPSFSPKGDSLVFNCIYELENNTCTIRPDGTGFNQLNIQTKWYADPEWSPLDDSIAVVKESKVNNFTHLIDDIYLITKEGKIINQITHNPSWTGNSINEIQWSPDGKRIAFSINADMVNDKMDVYLVNSDGTNLERLTFPPAYHYSPRWSPDGKELAYITQNINDTYLNLVDVSTSKNVQKQIQLNIEGGSISWSPDSKKLIYSSKRDKNEDIYEYDLSLEKEFRLTTDTAMDFSPEWTKDDSTILFVSNRSGKFDIFTLNITNLDIVMQVSNLTDYIINNPFWSVDNKKIYFFLSNYIANTTGPYELWSVDLMDNCS